jgi:hypothetical protein
MSRLSLHALFACLLLLIFTPHGLSASPAPAKAPATSTTPSATVAPTTASTKITSPTATSPVVVPSSSSAAVSGTPPDVYLNVPNLSVGRIELDVENLKADINLNANVASLVTINAGVAVSIQKVNLTITDVNAQLELIVRLGHLVDIVNRVFSSLDLNPLLATTISTVGQLLQPIVGAVDGLLGTITQAGTTLAFLVDNLGNIVQQVAGANGATTSTIVGNYLTNMTATGAVQNLQNGLVQKTYSYSPLNALVNIVFNAAGQVVQASVVKQTGGSTPTSSVKPTAT